MHETLPISSSALRGRPGVILALTGAMAVVLGGIAQAQPADQLPEGLRGVGVTDRSGTALPQGAAFLDDGGNPVALENYFTGERPVLMTMNYSSCPMLCSLHLNGLVVALKEMDWTIGDQYELVTISIDPTETTALARKTKDRYLRDYGRPGAGEGWHFLTGDDATIHQVADSLGFHYKFVQETGEYAHTAVTFVVTPDGVLSRNLYGVMYEPKTVRLSLVEASEGKIGTPIDKILLFCFRYDAASGQYTPVAMNIMRAGGAITLLILGVVVMFLWRREIKRRKAALAA